MRTIYCPWCTSDLTQRHGGLYCNQGRAGLSKAVEDEIMAALKVVEPTKKVDGPSKNNDYHCPNCASSLEHTASKLICKYCGFEIRSTVGYLLTEYHVHENWPGKQGMLVISPGS